VRDPATAREVTDRAGFALLHGVSVDDYPDLIGAAVRSYASGLIALLVGVTLQPGFPAFSR
jgi:hypothetical protein